MFSSFTEYMQLIDKVREARLSGQIHKDVAPTENLSFLNYLLVQAKDQRIWLAHEAPRLAAGVTSAKTDMDFMIPLISKACSLIAMGIALCQPINLSFEGTETYAADTVF